MAKVRLRGIGKLYESGEQAVTNLNLDIDDGEFLVLVGPSGCGKSTTLRMIAGLEDISEGELEINGQVVNDISSKDRDIAMVFQNYALYPHMSVADNIGFALKLAGVSKVERAERIQKVAEMLQLESYLKSKPGKLSGGQRQRVAMGRAIIRQPSIFLMDEPLSNLDAKLRSQMRAEIKSVQKTLGVTMFYVTHDQVEAMTMGDRVAVIKDGILQQVDTPQNLYSRPANAFVGAFIGSPAMNLYEGVVRDGGDHLGIELGGQVMRLQSTHPKFSLLKAYKNQEVLVGVRPEDIEDAELARSNDHNASFQADVNLVEALGSETLVHFSAGFKQVNVGEADTMEGLIDSSIARFDSRSSVAEGKSITVAVAVDNLHFFDAKTSLAISAD